MADLINKAYESAKAVLKDDSGDPTQAYIAYQKYETAYNSKKNVYNQAYQNALSDPVKLQGWPVEGVTLQLEVNQAMNNWIALGFKNEIEKAIAVLNARAT